MDGTFDGAVEDGFPLEPQLTLLRWRYRRYYIGAIANGAFGGSTNGIFRCSCSQRHFVYAPWLMIVCRCHGRRYFIGAADNSILNRRRGLC